jgi:acid phosphatase
MSLPRALRSRKISQLFGGHARRATRKLSQLLARLEALEERNQPNSLAPSAVSASIGLAAVDQLGIAQVAAPASHAGVHHFQAQTDTAASSILSPRSVRQTNNHHLRHGVHPSASGSHGRGHRPLHRSPRSGHDPAKSTGLNSTSNTSNNLSNGAARSAGGSGAGSASNRGTSAQPTPIPNPLASAQASSGPQVVGGAGPAASSPLSSGPVSSSGPGAQRNGGPPTAPPKTTILTAQQSHGSTSSGDNATLNQIDHFVVVYQENWSFDSLYPFIPGVNGIANAVHADGTLTIPQVDKSGNPLSVLPPVKGPDGNPDPRFPANLPPQPYNAVPYLIKDAGPGDPAGLTGDMIHRFYTEQQQLDGGKNDKFVSWSDNGGLVLSYTDAANLPEGKLAQQYTLDDNFFHAAFGGSFLNAQFLVSAAAPEWNQPLPANAPRFVSTLDASGAPLVDGNLTANNLLAPDGNHFVVNTTQPAQAPHRPGTPADQLLQPINDNHPLLASGQPDPTYRPTIGDRLDDAGLSWNWYAGGWSDALAGHPQVDPFGGGFQFHHQAFDYYANFAPFNPDGSPNPNTNSLVNPNAHMQDETRFFDDAAAGKLPAVSFVKPIGANNEHPGYASLLTGQQHVADIVHAVQNGPQWEHTAIIITYDENGGRWDHVSAPQLGDGTWGDGARVPAIVISPLAKKGFIDHDQHDTLSILKTIEDRFGLQPLSDLDSGASNLASDFIPPQPRGTGPDQHVLILSVDGLRQADVTDPNLAGDVSNIVALQNDGVSYTHAHTSSPSDSFPGTLSYLTGATPRTTGVYYDDSYSRTLFAPGTTDVLHTTPGTEVQYAEHLDRNGNLLSGGGNFDASGIDPAQLPVDSLGRPVYPSDFLKVNTLFGVAHQAGLYTAFSDKHPAYQIANGPGGNSIDDQYTPEVNSYAALGVVDPTTGKVTSTVNADSLLASDPFTDVSKYVLVDPSTDPLNVDASGQPIVDDPSKFTDPNLETITNNTLLTERYDDLKVQAILNEIGGKTSRGNDFTAVPNLFGMNFQAVSVAEKFANGGIVLLPSGDTAPSQVLEAAMRHTDASIGAIAAALQNTADGRGASIWDSTDLIVTAKHGQNPRVGAGGLMADSTLPDLLAKAGTPIAEATQDDISIIYLKDQRQTAAAAAAIDAFRRNGSIDVYFQGTHVKVKASSIIDQILSGPALLAAGYGNPLADSTTPDIIVTLKPGYIWVGNPQHFAFKRAEHGGVNEDDTHVPLIVSGGALPQDFRGTSQDDPVDTRQIAVSAANMLGLYADTLNGVVLDHTRGLPGLHVAVDQTAKLVVNRNDQANVGAFYDPSTTDDLNKYKVTVQWGDDLGDRDAVLVRDPGNAHIVHVLDRHTYDSTGIFDGEMKVTPPHGDKIKDTFTARVLDNLTAVGVPLSVNANQAFDLKQVATLVAQNPTASPDDYSARIDWGDGYWSNGVIVDSSTPGAFAVLGSHTYVGHVSATYMPTIYIKDKLGSEAVAKGEADVTFVPPAQSVGTAPALNPPGAAAGPNGSNSVTPQGWHVSPAGVQTQLGDRPFGIALSPDGKYLAVTNDGASTQSVMIVDRAANQVVSEIDYNAPQGVYVGIAFSPDGSKLYASAGGSVFNKNGANFNGVRVYAVDGGTGKLTETDPLLIPMPIGPTGKAINLFTAGLALSADGKTLYVADNLAASLSVIDLTSADATTGGAATTLAVGAFPFAVALSHDGHTAYVSNQGGQTVSVIDLTRPVLAESDRIPVGTHPGALALNPVNNELYVANADSDTISVIDTSSNVVMRTIDLSPYPGARQSSSPSALAVSPDGGTLYVANAANDDVAVIALGSSPGGDKVNGLIPTAWYPTALLVSANGQELDVLNAKGLGAGPNTSGPNPYTNPYSPPDQYIATMIKGSLSQIALPDATGLATYTQKVVANNGFNEGDKVRVSGPQTNSVIPLHPGDPTPIQHVIYVIKENRTFDQEFGSLGKGNGDAALNLFGDESAPNARALEKRFVTLDNFYSDAEVSADGWNWSTGALANSYVQHAWPQNYGGQNRPYDFEGGNFATSNGTDPTDSFIWNKLSDAGISYRNYGFRVFAGQVAPTEPRLAANTDLKFAGYDLRKPDSVPDLIQTGVNQPTRIAEWLSEFKNYEATKTLPTVEFVRLPNDHTATDTPGAPTPRAYVADNDLALGKLVDAVSHSADWAHTAIFVIEDDAQEGPDHVDAHRTIAQVISPYTYMGKVDSTFYSQVSVLRTIEQIVGIAPMTQFDAAATPLLNSFRDTPNLSTYSAVVPSQNVHEKNPLAPVRQFSAYGSLDQAATAVDQNESLENQGIWASIYGYDNPMPAPQSGLHMGGPSDPGPSGSTDPNGQGDDGN